MTLPWDQSYCELAWIRKGFAPLKILKRWQDYSLRRPQIRCSVKLRKSRVKVASYFDCTLSYSTHAYLSCFDGFQHRAGFPSLCEEIYLHLSHFVSARHSLCRPQPWKVMFRCLPEACREHPGKER